MGDTLRVEITDSHNYLGGIELDNSFWEPFLALENFIKLTTSHEGHNKVETEL